MIPLKRGSQECWKGFQGFEMLVKSGAFQRMNPFWNFVDVADLENDDHFFSAPADIVLVTFAAISYSSVAVDTAESLFASCS